MMEIVCINSGVTEKISINSRVVTGKKYRAKSGDIFAVEDGDEWIQYHPWFDRYPIPIRKLLSSGIKKFRCPDCGWIGTEKEMEADYIGGCEGESWSNWICPDCLAWWRLDDYEIAV